MDNKLAVKMYDHNTSDLIDKENSIIEKLNHLVKVMQIGSIILKS
jgi:hypothetical protein